LVQLSGGVKEGDTIVVSGVLFVRPNTLVKIRAVKTELIKASADSNLVSK